jgi:uncharacterized membrane protein (DUF373 family)
MFSIDELPWWEWPDFARVALVLAAVAGIGALFNAIMQRRRHDGSAAPRTDADSGGPLGADRREYYPTTRHEPGWCEDPNTVGAPSMTDELSQHEEFPTRAQDPVLRVLHRVMRVATYVLAIAMVVVILEGVVSVLHTLYTSITRPPYFMVPDIVQTFGAFLAVLIAYEIFANITLYLRTDVFPVKLVVATAMMAIARKIIILDTDQYSALDLMGMGLMVLALGAAYWLISQADARPSRQPAQTDQGQRHPGDPGHSADH